MLVNNSLIVSLNILNSTVTHDYVIDDVDEKNYVPPMFRSSDYQTFPFFKDT